MAKTATSSDAGGGPPGSAGGWASTVGGKAGSLVSTGAHPGGGVGPLVAAVEHAAGATSRPSRAYGRIFRGW
jgi:hypothetical protein